jgi:hypothetical protein
MGAGGAERDSLITGKITGIFFGGVQKAAWIMGFCEGHARKQGNNREFQKQALSIQQSAFSPEAVGLNRWTTLARDVRGDAKTPAQVHQVHSAFAFMSLGHELVVFDKFIMFIKFIRPWQICNEAILIDWSKN